MQKYLEHVFAENSVRINPSVKIEKLDLINTQKPNTLTFIDDAKYLKELVSNPFIVSVIATASLRKEILSNRNDLDVIEHEDPRWLFYTAFNHIAKNTRQYSETVIDKTTTVHPRAYVAPRNVTIGKNCIIYPNATVLEDVEIGDNCVVQSGAVIGSEGFEYKKTTKGILPVYHDGKVIIGNNVDIGANTCVDKGFSFRDTRIKDHVKIDNLVHVAHAVHIDEGSFIIASSMLAGSCTIGKNVWVGPNASVGHVKLADSAFITFGSVVTRDVAENETVTGNWAIPHTKFLRLLKKNIQTLES
jgi:UDP-3-O-[3-hydroxymyristoyl] glucosamine N-acyltransferase LpxD